MPARTIPRVTMLGSYVPRQCGIATFTHDLASAIANDGSGQSLLDGQRVGVVAMNDRDGEYKYDNEVILEISQHNREQYRNAAEVVNTSRTQVVCLQHEYGLFGGECGDYLFDFLDRLRKPVVSTFHTVLSNPSDAQKRVLHRVGMLSRAVVVMANRARLILNETYGVPMDRIRMIHHGVPDLPFGDTEPFKERFGLCGRPVVLTFGLLSPGKGIETMLNALAQVVPDHPDVAYIVLGVTHPGVRRESGEQYRMSLERRAVELGIQQNVMFHNRYVSKDDLRDYLQAADAYATPYCAKEQITSGTLAYALAAGKAIISTPYWHAEELLANGRGFLVDFGDATGFAKALCGLLDDGKTLQTVRRAAYDYGREMVWPRVAEQYIEVFEQALKEPVKVVREAGAGKKALMRMSLPELRLDHFHVMTDDTGMLQHALYATPDRRHGYCTDDNARALIVASMVWSLFQDESVLPNLHTYLGFLHYAQACNGGRFRNTMSYDRRWLDRDGSDDCQGRVAWALGYLISHAPTDSTERLAVDLFRSASSSLGTLRWPRSWAFSILGLHYYLRRYGDDGRIRGEMQTLAERLHGAFAGHASDDWPWFEDVVTYDNGRAPQAMIIAGLVLGRDEMVDRGLGALQWLMDVQTAGDGHFAIIGNDGWYSRGGQPARFDQQPLDIASLIGACKAAYRASGDSKWLVEMRRCFEWFLGRNDLGLSLIDYKTRGCYDGLRSTGVNHNQGAESLLSWILSLLIMHEMQTGDAPDVG